MEADEEEEEDEEEEDEEDDDDEGKYAFVPKTKQDLHEPLYALWFRLVIGAVAGVSEVVNSKQPRTCTLSSPPPSSNLLPSRALKPSVARIINSSINGSTIQKTRKFSKMSELIYRSIN